MKYDVWAYYRGGADWDFKDALCKAARKMDFGSGSGRTFSDVSFAFPTARGAMSAATRMKAAYRKFGKSGHIEVVVGYDSREQSRRKRIVVKAARRRTSRR